MSLLFTFKNYIRPTYISLFTTIGTLPFFSPSLCKSHEWMDEWMTWHDMIWAVDCNLSHFSVSLSPSFLLSSCSRPALSCQNLINNNKSSSYKINHLIKKRKCMYLSTHLSLSIFPPSLPPSAPICRQLQQNRLSQPIIRWLINPLPWVN